MGCLVVMILLIVMLLEWTFLRSRTPHNIDFASKSPESVVSENWNVFFMYMCEFFKNNASDNP